MLAGHIKLPGSRRVPTAPPAHEPTCAGTRTHTGSCLPPATLPTCTNILRFILAEDVTTRAEPFGRQPHSRTFIRYRVIAHTHTCYAVYTPTLPTPTFCLPTHTHTGHTRCYGPALGPHCTLPATHTAVPCAGCTFVHTAAFGVLVTVRTPRTTHITLRYAHTCSLPPYPDMGWATAWRHSPPTHITTTCHWRGVTWMFTAFWFTTFTPEPSTYHHRAHTHHAHDLDDG